MSKKVYNIAAIGFAHSHIRGNIYDFANCVGRVNCVAQLTLNHVSRL